MVFDFMAENYVNSRDEVQIFKDGNLSRIEVRITSNLSSDSEYKRTSNNSNSG